MRRDDLLGRVLGIVVFLGGVGLLAFVFVTAHGFFTSSAGMVQVAPVKGAAAPISARLGESFLNLVARIGFLAVMAFVGSLLAGKGIHLYLAATGRHTHMAKETEKQ